MLQDPNGKCTVLQKYMIWQYQDYRTPHPNLTYTSARQCEHKKSTPTHVQQCIQRSPHHLHYAFFFLPSLAPGGPLGYPGSFDKTMNEIPKRNDTTIILITSMTISGGYSWGTGGTSPPPSPLVAVRHNVTRL